jgi:hypothetical protein
MQRVRSVKASDEEWTAWEGAAAAAGLSVNGWMRRAANEQVGLERAVSEEVPVRPVPVIRSSAQAAAVSFDLAGKFRPDPRK